VLQKFQPELQSIDEAARRKGRITYPPRPLEPRTETKLWLITASMLFGCWLVLAWPWLSGQVTIPWDAKAHFHAQVAFMAQSFARGESPFWAPQVFAGHPQIADPQSLIFSPPHVLLAWLNPTPSMQAVDSISFVVLLFGALGVLGFARDKHWHPAAALVAALAFAMSGGMGWRIQHTGQILSIAYFPWALWMLERALRLSSIRYGVLSGFFASLILLDPDQVAFLGEMALLGYVIAHWMVGPGVGERMRRSLPPLFMGAAVGCVLTLLPTLMVLGFADISNRAHFTIAEAEMGSLHPSSLLTFVIGNLFGTTGPAEQFWGAPSVHWPFIVNSFIARNMANFYMGVLPLAGILLWLGSRPAYRARAIVFTVMFALMIAYALGRYTPIFAVLYHWVPGVDMFRRPADSLFLVTALGAYLAGMGLNALLHSKLERPRLAMAITAGIVAVMFVAGIGMAIWLEKFRQSTPDIAIALAFILGGIALLRFAMEHAQTRPMAVAALLGAVMVADLGWHLRPNDSTGLPPAEYDAMRADTSNDTIRTLQSLVVRGEERRDRVELAGLGFHWPNLGLVHDLESTLGYNPLRLKHFARATGAGDHVSGVDQHKFGPLYPSYRSPLGSLLGLRFIALGAPIEEVDPRMRANPLPLVARTKDAYIYENIETLPRVMVVPEAQVADQDRLVNFGEWPSTDFRRVAFIERTAMPLPRTRTTGTARILNYTNTEIRVAVQATRGGVLLLNDVWHPWWFAEIDGKRTPVLRANGIFRAVILPAGATEVVFRFEPVRGLIRGLMTRAGVLK
jgi:hypothetical protein